MTKHPSHRLSGSILVTIMIASTIFLTLLTTAFSFSGFLQNQISRETKTHQAVVLGQAGVNRALADLRVRPNFRGRRYTDMTTGVVDTYITPATDVATHFVITAQSYVPDPTSPRRVCRTVKTTVDTADPAIPVVAQTYEERSECPLGSVGQNRPPVLTITDPDGTNDIVTIGSSYTIKYSLTDPDSVVAAHFFYDSDTDTKNGTALNGECAAAPQNQTTCTWVIPSTITSEASYYIYGTADDQDNEPVTALSPGQITVKNTPPTLSFSEPDGVGDTVSRGSGYAITYTLTDPDNQVQAHLFYDDDTDLTDADGPGQAISGTCAQVDEGTNQACQWDTSAIPIGSYYIYGTVTDGVTPPATAFSPGRVTLTNSPPLLVIAKPDANGDTIAQDGSYTIDYSLSDPDDTVTASFYYDKNKAQASNIAIPSCAAVPEDQTSCIWNTTGVAPGQYYIVGKVQDSANGQVVVYSAGQLTINAKPTLTITEPSGGANDTITASTTYPIKYSLDDSDSTLTAKFYYDPDQNPANDTSDLKSIGGACSAAPEGISITCNWNTTGVTPGSYYIYGETSDGINAKVTAFSLGKITITACPPNVCPVNQPPTFSISEPNGVSDTIGQNTSFSIRYTLTDTDSTNATAAFSYSATDSSGYSGTPINGACANAPKGTNVTCIWDTTGLASGTYYVFGRAIDTNNNEVKNYAPGQMTINARPTLAITKPNSDTLLRGTSFAVTYTLADPDNTTTVTLRADVDTNPTNGNDLAIATPSGGTSCTNAPEGQNVTCQWETTNLAAGTYYVFGAPNDGVNQPLNTYSLGPLVVKNSLNDPSLVIHEPNGVNDSVMQGQVYFVTYSLNDPDDTVTARLTYGNTQTLIAGCAQAPEGDHITCAWDTTGVTPGTYTVFGSTSDGKSNTINATSPGQVTITSRCTTPACNNLAPTLMISRPYGGPTDTVSPGSFYSIIYSLSDSDNSVTASLSYDADTNPSNDATDRHPIGSCSNVPEAVNGVCTWDTTAVSPGSYYIVGVVTDGTNPPVTSYSPGKVTISSKPTLAIASPSGMKGTNGQSSESITQGAIYDVKYALNDPDDTVLGHFSYTNGTTTTALTGECANAPEGPNMVCHWNTAGVTPGTYQITGQTNDSVTTVKATSPGYLTIQAGSGTSRPWLAITSPSIAGANLATNGTFVINYGVSNVTSGSIAVNFYLNPWGPTNPSQIPGQAISSCQGLTATGSNLSCSFTPGDVNTYQPNVNYYIYGQLLDGKPGTIPSAYSPGTLTIGGTATYQCSDGIDNDNDGKVDYPDDQGCNDTGDSDETDPTPQFDDVANSVARDSLGNLYVAGFRSSKTSRDAPDYDLIVRKYTAAGTLDSSWQGAAPGDTAQAGTFVYTDWHYAAQATAIGVDSTNNVYIGGIYTGNARPIGTLIKLKTNGQLETAFQSTGMVTADPLLISPFPSTSCCGQVTSLAFDSSNNIFITATYQRALFRESNMMTLKFTPSGTLATAWGTSGAITYDGGNNNGVDDYPDDNDYVMDSTITSDGSLYMAGFNGKDGWTVLKYGANGILDTGFGTNGKIVIAGAKATTITHDATGNIFVGGIQGSQNNDWIIRKYTASGAVDTSWGTSGAALYTPGTTNAWLAKISVDATGNLIAIGQGNTRWVIKKYPPTGVDFLFSTIESATGYSNSFTTDPIGNIYIVGALGNPPDRDWLLRKYAPNLTLDTSFGSSGSVTYNSAP